MLVIRYCKTGGAEFISHLDTMRHIGKTIKRAGIDIKFSNGFNHHMLIFMSSPIGVGLKSEAEYCFIESDESPETFKEKFNLKSPSGIKCLEAYGVKEKINVAALITSAIYRIEGLKVFDVNDILGAKSFMITDKRGEEKEVRDKIYDMKFENEVLFCRLAFGNFNLRADCFADKLCEIYGGEIKDILKTDARINDNENIETVLR